MSSRAILILTTCGNAADARELAEILVEQRYAACVSRVEGIVSTYRWESKIEESQEALLLVKTTRDQYEAVERTILEKTSYELPDILVVPIEGGFTEYLTWLTSAVSQET